MMLRDYFSEQTRPTPLPIFDELARDMIEREEVALRNQSVATQQNSWFRKSKPRQ
jgi:hypothetical protein